MVQLVRRRVCTARRRESPAGQLISIFVIHYLGMTIQKLSTIAGSSLLALALSVGVASADTLTVACAGTPSPTSVTWTSTVTGGVAPVALLWSNSGTTSTQVINYSPGLRSISIRATDASSTVATSTCSAIVPQAVPTITSFGASATAITAGQSTVLSWVVSNASSTSIDNGLGIISSTSVTVSPTVTTAYHLTATNPGGSATSSVTVVVNGVVTPPTSVSAQIAALLQQIIVLKAQLVALLIAHAGGTVDGTIGTTTPPVVTNGQCDEFDQDMERGHRGGDVEKLQRILSRDHSVFPEGLITGFFGEKTQKAVERFERKHGLLASTTAGVINQDVRDFLHKHCDDMDDEDGNKDNHEDNHTSSNLDMTSSTTRPSINLSERSRENENDRDGKRGHGERGGRHEDDN